MNEETTNLELPFILSSQSQKHITHNEALQRLDALVHLVILGSSANPPAAPIEGACYAVLANATGAWAGNSGSVAFRQDGDWLFLKPRTGWVAWFASDSRQRNWNGAQWSDIAISGEGSAAKLGINTQADNTNKFAVSSNYTLFAHEGYGHTLKINKASIGDTASIAFQTGMSGRAELGLQGSDLLEARISADNNVWKTAWRANAKGIVQFPNNPIVRTSYNETNFTPPNNTLTGFTQLPLVLGGFALGATVASGKGNYLVIPTVGVYQITLNVSSIAAASYSISVVRNGTIAVLTVRDSDSGTQSYSQSATSLVMLQEGDTLALLHTGTADIQFGYNKTELNVVLV